MRIATNKLTLVLAGTISLFAGSAWAQSVSGEVKKIDTAANKITIKHGPIKALDMDEGMTMVFRVQDPAMLNGVKAGDKVKFDAERVDGKITVTKIQKDK